MSSLSVAVETPVAPMAYRTKALRPLDHEHTRRGVKYCDLAIEVLEHFGLKDLFRFPELDSWLIARGEMPPYASPDDRHAIRKELKRKVETASCSARMAEHGHPAYRILCEGNGWRLEVMPTYNKRNRPLEKILSQAQHSQRRARLDAEAIDPVSDYPAYVHAAINLKLTTILEEHAEVNVRGSGALGDEIHRLLSHPMQPPIQPQVLIEAALQETPPPQDPFFQQEPGA